jgi:hypothetical protein
MTGGLGFGPPLELGGTERSVQQDVYSQVLMFRRDTLPRREETNEIKGAGKTVFTQKAKALSSSKATRPHAISAVRTAQRLA